MKEANNVDLSVLTTREFAAVRAMGMGKSREELAALFQVSHTTITNQLNKARTKLGMTPRELRQFAKGMMKPERPPAPGRGSLVTRPKQKRPRTTPEEIEQRRLRLIAYEVRRPESQLHYEFAKTAPL